MSHLEALRRHFQSNLDKGLGDLEAMIAGIWYRSKSGGKQLNPNKRPPGYRSQKLRNYLKERGARKTTLWGATAIRGGLEPEKKDHIIEFLRLVNQLPSDPETLKEALDACTDLYVQKVNSETPEIELPLSSTVQTSIVQLLSTQASHATAGKIPQGLVYALRTRQFLPCQNELSQKTTVFGGIRKSGFPNSFGWYSYLKPLSSRAFFIFSSILVPFDRIFDIISLRFSLVNWSGIFTTTYCLFPIYLRGFNAKISASAFFPRFANRRAGVDATHKWRLKLFLGVQTSPNSFERA